jgi:CBF1 interacting corepressor
MTKGLGFLMGKYFHPLTKFNQRRKFEAEQRFASQAKKEKEMEELRKKELEKRELELLAMGAVDEKSRRRRDLNFMYQVPDGIDDPRKEAKERESRIASGEGEEEDEVNEALEKAEAEIHEQEKNKEKEIGASLPRAPARRSDKLDQKFEFLKGAPIIGDFVNDFDVQHRPFGILLRNVQCTRCGQWGHKLGDRECPLKDIFSAEDERRRREDPLEQIMKKKREDEVKLKLQK